MRMEDQPQPVTVVSFLPTAIILIVVGWGGIYLLTQFTQPNGGARWLFFFC